MKEKILYLEKRGCPFFENDETVKNSDVGNYRITTPDYTVYDSSTGKTYFLEMFHGTKYNHRHTNLRTGKPLKKEVVTVENENALVLDAAFTDINGTWCDLRKGGFFGDYTLDNILETVNVMFHQDYTKIEFIG